MQHRKAIGRALAMLAIAALAPIAQVGTASAGSKAMGEPIYFGFSASIESTTIPTPENLAAVNAAVKSINANGGVGKDGRPLKAVVCDNHNTPNDTAACGRELADDDRIVATAGDVTVFGDDFNPPLLEAGIARLAPYPASAAELLGTNSYPVIGGTLSSFVGNAQVVLDQGFKKVAIIRTDLAEAAIVINALDEVFGANGVETVATVSLSATATDVSAAVQKALDADPDAVLLVLADPQHSQSIQQIYQQSGGEMPVITSVAQFGGTPSLAKLGPAANALLGTGSFPPRTAVKVPGVKQFNADMKKYTPKEKVLNDLAVNSWLGVYLLKYVLDNIDTYDRASVTQFVGSITDYETGGLTPTINFTAPVESPIPLPRLFNGAAAMVKVKNSKVVPLTSKKTGGLVEVLAPVSP